MENLYTLAETFSQKIIQNVELNMSARSQYDKKMNTPFTVSSFELNAAYK